MSKSNESAAFNGALEEYVRIMERQIADLQAELAAARGAAQSWMRRANEAEDCAMSKWGDTIRRLGGLSATVGRLEAAEARNGELAAELEQVKAALREAEARVAELTTACGDLERYAHENAEQRTKAFGRVKELTIALREVRGVMLEVRVCAALGESIDWESVANACDTADRALLGGGDSENKP